MQGHKRLWKAVLGPMGKHCSGGVLLIVCDRDRQTNVKLASPAHTYTEDWCATDSYGVSDGKFYLPTGSGE